MPPPKTTTPQSYWKIPVSLAFLGLMLPLFAQESTNPIPATGEPEPTALIPGEISDGTPSPPVPLPALPDFVVKSTVVREMDVVEPPPMPGLPTIEGTITATVHVVEDPRLPDPAPPPVPTADSQRNLLPEGEGDHQPSPGFVFVSATVYDHSRTLLRCHANGNAKDEITVWSNLDFNHFTGFSTFEVKTAEGGVRRYQLMMGVGNEDTGKQAELLEQQDTEYQPPEIPVLPDGQPAYVIKDAAPDPEAVQLVKDLHELYRCEGQRMAAAYQARIKAEEERRAYLLAHPPVPKNVTMNFWEREHPVGMSADTIKKGGGN